MSDLQVGFARLGQGAFLRLTGEDATRWLNGMVTNSIQALEPGQGNYNFLLNAQGRIQGDCNIYREPGDGAAVFVLETSAEQLDGIEAMLDKFIIMDDVVLERGLAVREDGRPVEVSGILLTGPEAASLLGGVADDEDLVPLMTCDPRTKEVFPKHHLDMIRGYLALDPGVVLASPGQNLQRFELWTVDVERVVETLREKWNLSELSAEKLEAMRVEAGVPKFGVDIRDKDLPQETNQTQALHFNKGCYLGQEIVERIRSRGQVHRGFVKLSLEGTAPSELPAAIESEGKAAGEITSVAEVEGKLLALGYVRREFVELKRALTYAGGTVVVRG